MMRGSRNRMVALLVGSWLSLTGLASAGPYVNVMQPCDCPPNHYSAMHVLTPIAWRWAAWCQGPCRYTFARVLRPEIAVTSNVKRYHCPTVNPLQFSITNYVGLNGRPPASTYQSPPQQESRPANAPQELPPPRPDMGKKAEQLQMPNEEPEKK
jgi:hypothetical protein